MSATGQSVYDGSPADGRFQLEAMAIRWALTGFYALFVLTGVIDVDLLWFAVSEGYLAAWTLYYTWYQWYELTRRPLTARLAYVIPFLDTAAVTLALIAIGDAVHPVWGAYFYIVVAVTFFYYAVIRVYTVWLIVNYALVGLALELRGLEPPVEAMLVAGVIMIAGIFNLVTYTGGERRLRGKISEVAFTDPLTRLRNRRGMEEALDARLASRQDGRALAVVMLDIDRFKRYNDQFGHLAADAVLEQVGELLAASVREPDLVARYGGDEFVIVFPGVTPTEASRLAERLRRQIARLGLCTVSVGVAVAPEGDVTATELVDMADAALLAAKQAGRNCVRGPFGRIAKTA